MSHPFRTFASRNVVASSTGNGQFKNRPDGPEYIVHLLGQVITVSLERVQVVNGLPTLEKADAL